MTLGDFRVLTTLNPFGSLLLQKWYHERWSINPSRLQGCRVLHPDRSVCASLLELEIDMVEGVFGLRVLVLKLYRIKDNVSMCLCYYVSG